MFRQKWILGIGILAALAGLGVGIYLYLRVPRTEKQKMGYALGAQVAESLREQGVEVDPAFLGTALQDVMGGRGLRISQEGLAEGLHAYQKAVQQRLTAVGEKNFKDVKAFLATNGSRKEVATTPKGLQYEVLKKGTGLHVQVDDTVLAEFRGTLMNGTEIESTTRFGHPMEIKVDQTIPGLREGLPLMEEGAVFRFFIPPDLAYGDQARPGIPPNSLLIYELTVVKVQPKSEPAVAPSKTEGAKEPKAKVDDRPKTGKTGKTKKKKN